MLGRADVSSEGSALSSDGICNGTTVLGDSLGLLLEDTKVFSALGDKLGVALEVGKSGGIVLGVNEGVS